jgi:hypothetical protein
MDLITTTALGAGLAWASGIRLYAAILIVGLIGRAGWVELPDALMVLSHTWVMWTAGVLALGEFIADKVPAFDSLWDGAHTFIRIPAGMLLSAGAFDAYGPGATLAAALVGGFITSSAHLAKTGTRAAINHSPEPFSNWAASTTEDVATLGGLWLVFQYPLVFLGLLVVFLMLAWWLIPKFYRLVRGIIRRVIGADRAPAPSG